MRTHTSFFFGEGDEKGFFEFESKSLLSASFYSDSTNLIFPTVQVTFLFRSYIENIDFYFNIFNMGIFPDIIFRKKKRKIGSRKNGTRNGFIKSLLTTF